MAGRQRDDPDRVTETDQHIDGLAPDRAAGPEQCDPDRLAGVGRRHVRNAST